MCYVGLNKAKVLTPLCPQKYMKAHGAVSSTVRRAIYHWQAMNVEMHTVAL